MTASILDPVQTAARPENNLVLTAPASEWTESLRRVAHMGRRHSSPVLANVLIEVAGEWATFITFDYEVALQTTLKAEHTALGPSDGRFLVPHAWFTRIIRTLTTRRPKDTPVSVRVNSFLDHELLTVEAAGYSVPVVLRTGAQEFPALPDALGTIGGPVGSIELPTDAVLTAMRRVMTATSADDTLPILTTIHMVATPGKLRIEATDRYRLATDSLALPEGDQSAFDILLPGRIWRHLVPSIRRSENVFLGVVNDGEHLTISAENFSASVLATAGVYPGIQSLFRTGSEDEHVTVDRAELAAAARIMRDLGGHFAPLQLEVNEDHMVLAIETDMGEEKSAAMGPKIPVAVTGELRKFKVAFNPEYLLEGIAATPGDKLKLSFKRFDLAKPVQLTDAAGTTRNPATYKYLVMPARMPITTAGAQ